MPSCWPRPRKFFSFSDISAMRPSGRDAGADRELARRLILDDHVDDDLVGRRARLGRDVHRLEEAEIAKLALGPVDQDAVVGIALGRRRIRGG